MPKKELAGVDGLICVNNRAGGHLGSDGMEKMFEDLKDLNLPLICAGGIEVRRIRKGTKHRL